MDETADRMIGGLELFLRLAKDPSWSSGQDNMQGMVYDIGWFLYEVSEFEWLTDRTEGSVNIFEFRWRGDGMSLSDVYRDFYRVYGLVAESEQFMRVEIEPEAIVFHVVVGNTDDPAHGHFLQFKLVGERIVEVIRRYKQKREPNRGELEKK